MNFLSHFYFDRDISDSYFVLGTVLPDLLKNADKTIVLHPEKLENNNPQLRSLIFGWKKHLEVDKHFHSSDFFLTHSHQLKILLAPAIEGSPVKPFFLGHIAIELIIDNLLITTDKLKVERFYDHLRNCDVTIIEEFLNLAGLKETDKFFRFFKGFKRDSYLHTYSDTEHIAYALKRICMRVWNNPFTSQQETRLNQIIVSYRALLLSSFMDIFNEIEIKLSTLQDE